VLAIRRTQAVSPLEIMNLNICSVLYTVPALQTCVVNIGWSAFSRLRRLGSKCIVIYARECTRPNTIHQLAHYCRYGGKKGNADNREVTQASSGALVIALVARTCKAPECV
jgi:hypothetical protein